MEKLEVKIRKYEEKDRESVRKICCDTGFWGKPIDKIFKDREIFAGIIVDPYLDLEPEHTFIAEDNGKVVGYLTGSIDYNFEIKAIPIIVKNGLKALWRYSFGNYNDHPRSKKFIKWALIKAIFQMCKHPKNTAHLHIDLDKNYWGKKIGLKLLLEYENMLKQMGINHYYGALFSSDRIRNESLYKKLGFEIFDKVETTIFKPEIERKLYIMCVHKKLS